MKFAHLLILLLFVGCSSRGYNRGELFHKMNQSPEVRGEDIKAALESKAQLPRPFTLLVHFNMYHLNFKKWPEWTREDKKKLLESLTSLRGSTSSIRELIVPMGSSTSIESLRYLSAQQGGDALLMINGAGSTSYKSNIWAITYIALLPAFFVKGTDYEGTFVGQALLYDVRNSHLYFAAEADSSSFLKGPPYETFEQQVVNEAKEETVSALSNEIRKQIEMLIKAENKKKKK